SELEIVDHALDAARQAAAVAEDAVGAERASDPGYHLIAQGRAALEWAIRFRPPPQLRISRFNTRLGIGGYIGSILLVTAMLLAVALWALSRSGLDTDWLVLFAL